MLVTWLSYSTVVTNTDGAFVPVFSVMLVCQRKCASVHSHALVNMNYGELLLWLYLERVICVILEAITARLTSWATWSLFSRILSIILELARSRRSALSYIQAQKYKRQVCLRVVCFGVVWFLLLFFIFFFLVFFCDRPLFSFVWGRSCLCSAILSQFILTPWHRCRRIKIIAKVARQGQETCLTKSHVCLRSTL